MSILKSATIAIAAGMCLLAASADSAEKPRIIGVPLDQLEWETSKEGVGFAQLQGNRFKEAYMAMVKLPAGLVSPPHIKSAAMYGLVVSGTIVNVSLDSDGAITVDLPAGSFYKIPAGLPHVSKCVSKVDCVTFLYQDGMFDFLPVVK